MQAKDIPELPILDFLVGLPLGQWAGWGCCSRYDVRKAVPDGTPAKVFLAKMRSLIARGLVSGCACGCRGDFEITIKGRELLEDTVGAGGRRA